MNEDLLVDPKRVDYKGTGILVPARLGSSWGAYDIACLTSGSLARWLQLCGSCNPWAENTVGLLLGHAEITDGPMPAMFVGA